MIRQIPQWGTPAEWLEVNCTLEYLLCRYEKDISRAMTLAREIQKTLEHIFPIQDELCLKTCMHCPDPCCLNATVWADYKDLLFFHLSDQELPQKQLIEKPGDTCRYHTSKGCSLPRLSRPWTCTLYLCPPQKQTLREFNADLIRDYEKKVDYIKESRRELEAVFMKLIT